MSVHTPDNPEYPEGFLNAVSAIFGDEPVLAPSGDLYRILQAAKNPKDETNKNELTRRLDILKKMLGTSNAAVNFLIILRDIVIDGTGMRPNMRLSQHEQVILDYINKHRTRDTNGVISSNADAVDGALGQNNNS